MKIFNQNNINFTGKPPELLAADKALRIMNAYYSAASGSRYKKFNIAKENPKLQHDIARTVGIKSATLRQTVINSEFHQPTLKFFNIFLNLINSLKISNCYELVKLFSFIMDLNGFESRWASLIPSEIDHCVALIPLKKDCFEKIDFTKTPMSKMKDFLIADPWLGIVDYAPNVATLYKNHPDCNRCIGSPDNYFNWETFVPKLILENYYLRPDTYHLKKLSEKDREFFAQNHPELFFNEKQLIKH